MIWFLAWLITVEALGLAILPLTVHLFRGLPDRGFIFSKALGILVVGYVCWIVGVLGLVQYQRATILAVALLVGAACWVAWGRGARKQIAGARTLVFATEAVFLVSLAGASLIRAFNPEISGTEKPMDFAFLNAMYRTDTLPPEDPWMSGHSISYYYFGYLLLATVAKLSAVPASVAYNLSVALVFALLLAGTFSVSLNLLSVLRPGWSTGGRLLGSLLAPTLIGLMGNLEVGLEYLATRGFSNEEFWKAVAIKGLQPATQLTGWPPESYWWWWRASRIIPTTKPDGINEFPFFSFLLGDLHPHFTALPWALLVVALALAAMLQRGGRPESSLPRWVVRLATAVVLGFLAVGNSWDFPTYTGLFWLGTLVPMAAGEWGRAKVLPKVKELALISGLSLVVYAPFFLGFASQTKGIGISGDRTPLPSMLIIFGAVLVALIAFLTWRAWPRLVPGDRPASRSWILIAVGGVLIVGSLLLGSASLLAGLLVLCVGAYTGTRTEDEKVNPSTAAAVFVLVLAGLGLALIIVPEFVFLVDLFGTRMNTVFKFHYQAWLLLGLAASTGLVWMVGEARSLVLRWAVAIPFALLVAVGLLYPVSATPSKIQDFKGQPTLDGAAYYSLVRPDDAAAILWLARSVQGRPVVLEATGGEYSEYARVSTFAGLPAVLGWAGHEAQWRGQGEEAARRGQDVDAIYGTAGRQALPGLLSKYNVTYVFVGSLEAEKYGPAVSERFSGLLEPVFRQGKVTVYRVPESAGQSRPSASGS